MRTLKTQSTAHCVSASGWPPDELIPPAATLPMPILAGSDVVRVSRANDPCDALKTTLKAEINEEAWATLNSDTSRPFDKPKSGRIAVKVINHLGDEVMNVFRGA
jgi:hypothetical protein